MTRNAFCRAGGARQVKARCQPNEERIGIEAENLKAFAVDGHPSRCRAEIPVGALLWRPFQIYWLVVMVSQRGGNQDRRIRHQETSADQSGGAGRVIVMKNGPGDARAFRLYDADEKPGRPFVNRR
ncbi:hypothetical protein GCM10011345_38320 [Gemmobacter megaterium]|nr:hypothetical protein GCM10011345_38320 [Gemmobacter megaterium]